VDHYVLWRIFLENLLQFLEPETLEQELQECHQRLRQLAEAFLELYGRKVWTSKCHLFFEHMGNEINTSIFTDTITVESTRRQGSVRGMWAFGNEKEHQTVKKALSNHKHTEMQQRMKHILKKWEIALRECNKDYDLGQPM
jgi:uncharacterized protein YpbB